ncbi:glucose dehydrogenase [Nephila pilipes]|uniref:Glucose dehydrogenase n=1 Tax=Nephila pilipes TaxID=299642 RepID=A0A8X6QWJ2_NEPPI|nr:glucose dehydrogenase [Nephila pilipes]
MQVIMSNQLSNHDLQEAKSYHTPLSGSPLLPLLLLSLMKQKSAPKTIICAKEEYDYVVVGAGAAGSVVASRLSEKPCVSVLLLEAGKAGPSLTDVPGFTRSFWGSDLNWDYKTVPQKNTGNAFTKNEIAYPQGKVTGGTSIFSFQIYTRGNKKDYDNWESQGAKGWSYKDVYPYFLKLENNKDPEFLHNGYHHEGGPLTVQKPFYYGEVKPPVFEAIKEMGYKVIDPNGAETTGK